MFGLLYLAQQQRECLRELTVCPTHAVKWSLVLGSDMPNKGYHENQVHSCKLKERCHNVVTCDGAK